MNKRKTRYLVYGMMHNAALKALTEFRSNGSQYVIFLNYALYKTFNNLL